MAESVAYTAPGMTVAEIETLLENATALDTDTAGQLTKIDQAITAVGQAATMWGGNGWWWMQADTQTFDTVADTGTYNLATVNSNAMQDIWAV